LAGLRNALGFSGGGAGEGRGELRDSLIPTFGGGGRDMSTVSPRLRLPRTGSVVCVCVFVGERVCVRVRESV